jgi:hypothetical protein
MWCWCKSNRFIWLITEERSSKMFNMSVIGSHKSISLESNKLEQTRSTTKFLRKYGLQISRIFLRYFIIWGNRTRGTQMVSSWKKNACGVFLIFSSIFSKLPPKISMSVSHQNCLGNICFIKSGIYLRYCNNLGNYFPKTLMASSSTKTKWCIL